MTKEELDDDWWVIGNIDLGWYIHWKPNGAAGGCFVEWADPETAEHYGSRDEAIEALQSDEDVKRAVEGWQQPAGPIHVKKGMTVSDEPEDGTPDIYNPAKRRAQLLYCMDYIMHHLSDEEAIDPWLAGGAPDGLYQTAPEPPAGDYRDLELGDTEFDEMVGLFIKTLAGEGRYRPNGLSCEETGKAVLS